MALAKVRMELARSPGFPEGSASRGYEFIAPLDNQGGLDPAEWKANKNACTVRRFWEGEADENGHLIQRGKHWLFDYKGDEEDDDEPLFRLDRHKIVEGEYLSVTEHDGVLRAFRIVSVRPLTR